MSKAYTKGALTLTSSIILAGALIALALIWINRPAKQTVPASQNTPNANNQVGVPKVSANEHILGNPNAPIMIIEYSDLSCPYCKIYNTTLERIMNVYGPTGKVAWVYRHFPLIRPVEGVVPHPNSLSQAEAIECAAQLGGNKAFFAFEKAWFASFEEQDVNRNTVLDRKEIDRVAKDIGLNSVSFNECMAGDKYETKINSAYDDGLALGITGTPLTIIVTPTGNQIPLVGLQTYSTLKNTIDTLITTIATSTSIKN